MSIRRLAASAACALSLAVPAAALAVPIQDPVAPKQQPAVVAYGDTKYDLQNQQDLSAPIGDTKSDLKPVVPTTPAAPSFAKHDDNTNGWQIAALAEAGLLAVALLGVGAAMTSRSRRDAQPGV
jgi:hypothetical protein